MSFIFVTFFSSRSHCERRLNKTLFLQSREYEFLIDWVILTLILRFRGFFSNEINHGRRGINEKIITSRLEVARNYHKTRQIYKIELNLKSNNPFRLVESSIINHHNKSNI